MGEGGGLRNTTFINPTRLGLLNINVAKV